MKPSIKTTKHEIGKSVRALTQLRAAKNDLAELAAELQELEAIAAAKQDLTALAAELHALNEAASADRDQHEQLHKVLDHKLAVVDDGSRANAELTAQCQTDIQAVKQALVDQTRDLAAAVNEADREHREQNTALEDRLTTMDATLREIEGRMRQHEEKTARLEENAARHVEAVQNRLQKLEAQVPVIEAAMEALDASVTRTEQLQFKINDRILTVMRISLLIIGVLAVTAGVVGWIFFKV